MNSTSISRTEYDRLVMEHLLHIESSVEAIASDVADIKASLDRTIAGCTRIQAMLVQLGREIERVH